MPPQTIEVRQTDDNHQYMMQLCTNIRNYKKVVKVYDPQMYRMLKIPNEWLNYLISSFFSILFITCILRLICVIPKDIDKESKRLIFYDNQKIRKCKNNYINNYCNTTTAPALLEKCENWRNCFENHKTKTISKLSYVLEIVDNFFVFLTPKSAALLGVVSAVFMFCNLFH